MQGGAGREHELALAVDQPGVGESGQGVESLDGVAEAMHQGLKRPPLLRAAPKQQHQELPLEVLGNVDRIELSAHRQRVASLNRATGGS